MTRDPGKRLAIKAEEAEAPEDEAVEVIVADEGIIDLP